MVGPGPARPSSPLTGCLEQCLQPSLGVVALHRDVQFVALEHELLAVVLATTTTSGRASTRRRGISATASCLVAASALDPLLIVLVLVIGVFRVFGIGNLTVLVTVLLVLLGILGFRSLLLLFRLLVVLALRLYLERPVDGERVDLRPHNNNYIKRKGARGRVELAKLAVGLFFVCVAE